MNSNDLKKLINDVFVVGNIVTGIATSEVSEDFHFDTKTIVIIAATFTALMVLKHHLSSRTIHILPR